MIVRNARIFTGALAIASFAMMNEAHATESVKRIGVQAGFAGVSSEGSFAGYGGALTFGYGVTDAWTLMFNATATSNQVQAKDKGGRSLVLSQAVGFQYALDILQIVPYFGFYAAVYEITGSGVKEIKPGAQLSLGLDYILSRDFTIGLEIRGHALPADFARNPSNPTPFYGTTMLKGEYTWGWF